MARRLPDGRIVCAGTICMDYLNEESSEEEDVEHRTMAHTGAGAAPARTDRRVEPAGSGEHCLG